VNDPVNQLEALYRETGPALLAYFQRRPALNAAAEDLLQDTFVRAFRQLEQLKTSVSPRAYLFGIARYVGIDALRKRHVDEEFDEQAVSAEERLNPRVEQMRVAIIALPAAQRAVLELKLQHELTYEEIADILKIPIGTVRSRLHHAVRSLREKLNPSQPTNESYENGKS
jgi:RNA polymerase sigma-70 factor (ECF subfamily)